MENKEALTLKIKSVKNPVKEIETVYSVLDELGVKYKKSTCSRCRRDLYNIALEELGLIKDAAEKSDFNTTTENSEYRFIHKGSVSWKGRTYDQYTPTPYIKHFLKYFPKGYYEVVEKKEETTIPQQEENINNEE